MLAFIWEADALVHAIENDVAFAVFGSAVGLVFFVWWLLS